MPDSAGFIPALGDGRRAPDGKIRSLKTIMLPPDTGMHNAGPEKQGWFGNGKETSV
jgi:hypothetical protein